MVVKTESTNNLIEIVGANCKNQLDPNHTKCPALWEGLGFIIKCSCDCHNEKKEAIDRSSNQVSIADSSPKYSANGAIMEDG